MAGKRLYLICAFILSLFVVAGTWAQAPSIPSDVQAIFNKMRSGQSLTDAEKTRMSEWGDSIDAAPAAGTAGAGNNPFASSAQSAQSQSQSSTPCPPAQALPVTAAAPTRAEYIVLVKSLVETYGGKLGTHRAEFDHIFAKPDATSSASQAGPVLFISGAAGASVYASAVAAVANPDDLLVASNLGVALDSIPDAKAASAVLLYAHKLAPQQAMLALNLAWVYFNSGHAAEAKALFQSAAVLDPDLSGAPAGLGMLASCKGDTATAMNMFRKSLSKGYSGVVAAGYKQAQETEEKQQQDSTKPPPSFPPSGNDDSGPLPELPATADPQETLGSDPAFQQAKTYADKEIQAATARLQDAQARVMAIVRRAQIDPDGTINLPRTFDKQIFEYGQIVKLTIGAPYSLDQTVQQAVGVMEPAAKQAVEQINAELPHFMELEKELEAARAANDAARAAQLQYEIDQIEFRWCKLNKGTLDTVYAQHFNIYKKYSDFARPASRDLYAYSQPIIDQIWVPSLNDLVQAERELAVLILYKEDAGYAAALAETARGYKTLKCIEPVPPKPPKTVKDPTLTKKEPDCPLNLPVRLGLGAMKIELGCDKVKISGGELVRFEVERNFIKKDTAFWVGVGASASASTYNIGGSNLGDNGQGWTPPSSPVNFDVTAQFLVGVRVNDSGEVVDGGIKSMVSATGNVGPLSGALGVTGSVTLENGPDISPVSKATVSY